jgi:hypothetical protein
MRIFTTLGAALGLGSLVAAVPALREYFQFYPF